MWATRGPRPSTEACFHEVLMTWTNIKNEINDLGAIVPASLSTFYLLLSINPINYYCWKMREVFHSFPDIGCTECLHCQLS